MAVPLADQVPGAGDPPRGEQVPYRTIIATIGLVLATLAGLWMLQHVTRIVAWMAVAGFFAVVLGPAVDWLVVRLRIPRSLAAIIMFATGALALAAMLYVFIRPVIDQAQMFINDLPGYVERAQSGQGRIGDLVTRLHLQQRVADSQDNLQSYLDALSRSAPAVLGRVFNTAFALLTITVLTILLLIEGPKVVDGGLRLIPPRHRERARHVGADMARAMSGYMLGNFLISVIAGVASYAFFRIAGVPYPEVMALWVAFTDLIPFIGATLGAVPTIALAFLHSTPAGIAAIVFFIVYQQFENHVLQVTVMARTVNVNPLTVLLSVLVGIDLFGYVGALLAIPLAGALQAIFRDLFHFDEGDRIGLRRSPSGEPASTPPD